MTENISDIEKLISALEDKISRYFELDESSRKHKFIGKSEGVVIGIQDALIAARKIRRESEVIDKFLKLEGDNLNIEKYELITRLIKKSIVFIPDVEKCKKLQKSKIIDFLKNLDFNVEDVRFLQNDVQFLHVGGGVEFWCDSKDESTGLLSCFYLAPFIFEAVENGHILIVNKKTAGLHPLLITHLEHVFIQDSGLGSRIIFI